MTEVWEFPKKMGSAGASGSGEKSRHQERSTPLEEQLLSSVLLEALRPFGRFADSMDQLGHDANVKHFIRRLTPDDFRKAREAIALAEARSPPVVREQLKQSVEGV